MPSVAKPDSLDAKDINDENSNGSLLPRTKLYERLKQREHSWWQSRQQLINRKERKMFWYGENSLMMWFLWQLVSYVIVAMLLMLLSKLLGIMLPLWQYIALFTLQTIIFVVMLAAKGQMANTLQRKIDKDELLREEAMNEMIILAKDSLYPDVHAHAPLSLREMYEYFDKSFHLASLHCLLKIEVDAGRLILTQKNLEADILPPDLADDELNEHASEMIYKSTL
jgi:uncharacterized membrane protein